MGLYSDIATGTGTQAGKPPKPDSLALFDADVIDRIPGSYEFVRFTQGDERVWGDEVVNIKVGQVRLASGLLLSWNGESERILTSAVLVARMSQLAEASEAIQATLLQSERVPFGLNKTHPGRRLGVSRTPRAR